jgi:hypothetical protein
MDREKYLLWVHFRALLFVSTLQRDELATEPLHFCWLPTLTYVYHRNLVSKV